LTPKKWASTVGMNHDDVGKQIDLKKKNLEIIDIETLKIT